MTARHFFAICQKSYALGVATFCTFVELFMKSDELVIVRGDVFPLAGNKDCRAIVVDGDVEYRIQPRGAGADIVEHFSEQVEVEGTLSVDEDGVNWMQVRRYCLVDALDEDALYED